MVSLQGAEGRCILIWEADHRRDDDRELGAHVVVLDSVAPHNGVDSAHPVTRCLIPLTSSASTLKEGAIRLTMRFLDYPQLNNRGHAWDRI